jgi:hypothetical protein
MVTLKELYPKILVIIISTLILLNQFTVSAEINKKPGPKLNGPDIPSLQLLKEKLKNVEFSSIAVDIITKIYGKPSRYIGSGDPAPQWDVEGGFITCFSISGVIYSKKSKFSLFDDDIVSLIDTVNRVDETLMGVFMMFDLPQESSRWLGDLKLKKEGQYLCNGGTGDDFFYNHSSGTYTIEYQSGIKPSDLLENMKSGDKLAKIVFQAGDSQETFSLYFYTKGRGIVAKSADNRNLSYEMVGYWKNSYYKLTGLRTLPPFAFFKEQIKTASDAREAHKIIRKNYGEAHRVTDSLEGAVWFQWDIDGGVLFFHLNNGVIYEKMGQRIYLIDTQNKVAKTIIGYYTLRALIAGDTIGNYMGYGLELGKDGKYKLKTFDRDISKEENKNEIFFFQYPNGTYTLKYQKGINPDEPLENMKEGTVLGEISFTSGTYRESFYIYIKERHLIFKPVNGKPQKYSFVRYWNNYHQKNDGQ